LEATMPYLNIKLSALPSAEISGRVAKRLTELTAELLKKKSELTAVSVEFADPETWFIGGKSLAEYKLQSFYLDIKVTRGTNTKDEKANYLARIFTALEEILGPVHPTSYAVIHEIDADAWGYQGHTQELRFISGRTQ
jgi:4-oxalocrotonate tautomerase